MTFQRRRQRILGIALGALLIVAAGAVILATLLDDDSAADPVVSAQNAGADGAQAEQHSSDLAAQLAARRDPDVPELPFADNPDPTQCGIPTVWGKDDPAWLTGYYEGEMIQPVVYLYDSHNRLSITAQAPHGSQVEVVLFQSNPVTDYYMVRVLGPGGETTGEGWIPAPFLSFEPVAPLPDGA